MIAIQVFSVQKQRRARINKIKSIKRSDGTVVTSQVDLEMEANPFYKALFMIQGDTEPTLVTNWVTPKITDAINSKLCAPITNNEIEEALFMMHLDRSPGPDGFTAGFYIHHWSILKDSVCAAIRNFLDGGDMPELVNSTVLVLIPKVKNPQEFSQDRSISLCNVLYKIASKVLALRLRPLLEQLIAEEQSAFVLGRLITDNVILAYGCVHYLRREKGKSANCTIKLDMAKA